MDKQIIEPTNKNHRILFIVITILLTAGVVGGSVYYVFNKQNKELEKQVGELQKNQTLKKTEKTIPSDWKLFNGNGYEVYLPNSYKVKPEESSVNLIATLDKENIYSSVNIYKQKPIMGHFNSAVWCQLEEGKWLGYKNVEASKNVKSSEINCQEAVTTTKVLGENVYQFNTTAMGVYVLRKTVELDNVFYVFNERIDVNPLQDTAEDGAKKQSLKEASNDFLEKFIEVNKK